MNVSDYRKEVGQILLSSDFKEQLKKNVSKLWLILPRLR